jgi:serine/threonine protein kinase
MDRSSSGELTCLREDAIAAFAEGRVAPEAQGALEDHLANCGDCRTVLARVTSAARGQLEMRSAPHDDHDDAEELMPGRRVGRYVIEVLIGRGAMGAVYAATDPDLHRKVAVKLLRADALSDRARTQMRSRLLREAQAMARLSHPEVITVHDVGSFGDQLFVAMEYVEGETLRRWRCAKHRSCAEILAVYERAGSGLAAAHEAGLVHRDFKPDNVLVGRDGRVRVTDFGLARSVDEREGATTPAETEIEPGSNRLLATLTRTGTLLGTPAYMAPEQLRGGAADARSDVFSFCVALYEALYGERPFAGATVVLLQSAIEQGRMRAAPVMTPVPAWLRAVLLRGLRAKPEERFASMRALLDALRAAHGASRRQRAIGLGAAALAIGLASLAVLTRHAQGVSNALASSSAPTEMSSVAGGLTGHTSLRGSPALADAPEASAASSAAGPPLAASLVMTKSPPFVRHPHPRAAEAERRSHVDQAAPRIGNNGALILE